MLENITFLFRDIHNHHDIHLIVRTSGYKDLSKIKLRQMQKSKKEKYLISNQTI